MKKRLLSFKFAFRGLFFLFKDQPNAWIHLVAAIGVIIAGIFFRLSNSEWMFTVSYTHLTLPTNREV